MKRWNKWGRWGAAVLVMGCGSRLQVDASAPTPPVPGSKGQSCIPSETVTEAPGTVGQADVVYPAHCSDGLTCGSDGICAQIPECPQASGICTVFRAAPNVAGGSGSGGASGDAAVAYGYPGVGGNGAEIATPTSGVQSIDSDYSRIYWVEYGTRDLLGNYRNDGALKAFDGNRVTTLSSNLPGPIAIGLTSSYIYVYVDGAPLISGALNRQLLRVPVAGGDPEFVQEGTFPRRFVGVGDKAFWTDAYGDTAAIYAMTAEPGATPSVFEVGGFDNALETDGTSIYYVDSSIMRAPMAGGPPVSTGLFMALFFLRGDSIYGLDNADGVLERAPKTGGTVERVRALGDGQGIALQAAGGRIFWEQTSGYHYNDLAIRTTSFEASAPIVRAIATSVRSIVYFAQKQWVATPTALYWHDGSAIYSRSLSDLP